jgi:hypothetical protein
VFDEEVRINSNDEEAVMEETGGNKKVIPFGGNIDVFSLRGAPA